MSTATLYLFCGKMASGKSTLADQMARQMAAQKVLTLISEDKLLSELYPGEVIDVPSYARFSGRVKLAMRPILVDLLRNGVSVVLDFPANTVRQRIWLNELAEESGAQVEFHFLDSSEASCKARLKERFMEEPGRQATDTDAMFDAITRYFEPPSSDEGLEIIAHAE